MTTSNLFLELTDRHGAKELRNMALYALVARSPDGGCKLYPGSQNERYDGQATYVQESLAAFADLPGFVLMETGNHVVKGKVLVNMAKVTFVADGERERLVHFVGSTSRLNVYPTLAEIREAMGRDASPPLAHRQAG